MPSSNITAVPVTLAPGRFDRFRKYASLVAAWLLAALFFASGLWKLLDLSSAAERMVQSLVPLELSLAAAVLVGAGETFTAACLLIPKLRRWGALLAAFLLIAFMVYIAVFYRRLLGDDCNCFPWIRRVVGPAFFIGDGAMLLLAVVAAWGAQRSRGIRSAATVFAVVAVLALAGLGLSKARHSDIVAPASIQVDGRAASLHSGRVILFFYDPECTHCLAVARKMSKWDWGSTRVVALPTEEPEYARFFLNDSGLKAGTSLEAARLRQTFRFTDPPYVAALAAGEQAAAFNAGELETPQFEAAMGKLGFVRSKGNQ